MNESQQIIESQLRECYGRTVYSHKTHEKCADILLNRLSKIKLVQIVLSSITTGSFLSTVFGSDESVIIIGAIASTILLMLSVYTKNDDLGELAQKHKQAANDIWLIREQYLSLLVDLSSEQKSLLEIQTERDRLTIELHAIYSNSPSTNSSAYKKAQEALKHNEDMTFSDEEINSFLPKKLRKEG